MRALQGRLGFAKDWTRALGKEPAIEMQNGGIVPARRSGPPESEGVIPLLDQSVFLSGLSETT